jgi:predicted CXXCH cytochrome family protein
VDEETVFVDRPVFDLPSDTVFNMLGYYRDRSNPEDPYASKQTACGNCHATYQKGWLATGHADAWAGLQSSPGAAEYCESCHTVSKLGNVLTDDAGWELTRDARYHDVQCESCHGPGAEHSANPSTANAPLCSVEAGTTATVGCGECHSGEHHPFVDQWEESGHGQMHAWDVSSATRTVSRCTPCHEGRAALEVTFGEPSNYLEKSGPDPQPINCVVCHDPHSDAYEYQLRADIGSSGLTNLCTRCHANRGTPPSEHGPHAAQGLLVLATNVGWIPPDFLAPTFGGFLPDAHAHGDTDDKCATCHVTTFTVTEPEFFQSVGHTFEAVSCLDDVTGEPVPGPCTNDERDFRACATCHATEENSQTLYEGIVGELNLLLDELWTDTNGDCVLDPAPTDGGLLAGVVAAGDSTDLDPRDDLITTAEGAWWNGQLAYTHERPCWGEATLYFGIAGPDEEPEDGTPDGIHVSAHKASGEGVHNPDLLVALLEASIEAVTNFYGNGP